MLFCPLERHGYAVVLGSCRTLKFLAFFAEGLPIQVEVPLALSLVSGGAKIECKTDRTLCVLVDQRVRYPTEADSELV